MSSSFCMVHISIRLSIFYDKSFEPSKKLLVDKHQMAQIKYTRWQTISAQAEARLWEAAR